MRITRKQLTVYALGHFWMDLCCALLLFSRLRGTADWPLWVLLYNFCAFGLQMPLGLAADRLSRNSCVAAAGCALTALGWGAVELPALAVLLAGVGNALFHVGGGVDTLNACGDQLASLGVFVAPGALGVGVGTLLGKSWFPALWLPALGLVCFGGLFIWLDLRLRGSLDSGNPPVEISPDRRELLALGCLFLAVLAHTRVDASVSFPWAAGAMALAVPCCAALGRLSGGFLADRLGRRGMAALSLLPPALLLCLGGGPAAGLAGEVLFHMATPVLLWSAARLLPGSRGFGFGLMKFALFLGFLSVWLGRAVPAGPWTALWTLCALGLLLAGLREGEGT